MLYDSLAWGAIAAIVFLSVDTGGGGYVEGDARSGRDFSGRDRNEINVINNPPGGDKPDEENIEWRTIIYGNRRMNYPGMLNRLKALENEIILMRIGGIVLMIFIFSLMLALAIVIRAWGGQ